MNTSRYLSSAFLLFVAIFFIQSCGAEDPFSVDYSQVPPPYDQSEAISDTTLPQGVHIYTLEEGTNAGGLITDGVTPNDRIIVKYTGRTEKGKVFTSSYGRRTDKDTNFKTTFRNLTSSLVRTNYGRVYPLVKGLRKGLMGMKPGEKRIIVVPPELGSSQQQRGIELEGKTLIYNVELVSIIGIP